MTKLWQALRRSRLVARVIFILSVAAELVGGQSPITAEGPTPHPLGPRTATSSIMFARITDVRVLSDGRVLINDPTSHTIVLLDSTLAHPVVVLDSTGGKNTSYGARAGGLLPFYGDSSLFFDGTANAFLVLDPVGRINRTIAGWPVTPFVDPYQRVDLLATSHAALAGLQSSFSLSLGLLTTPLGSLSDARFAAITPDPNVLYRVDDSASIIALNLGTRVVDTVGSFLGDVRRVKRSPGSSFITTEVFQPQDLHAVVADGSLAIVRAREYRIDWVNPDRSRTAGPRLPYPWQRLSESDRARIVDSSNVSRAKAFEEKLTAWIEDSANVAQGKPRNPAVQPSRTRPAAPRPAELADVGEFIPAIAGGMERWWPIATTTLWIRPRALNNNAGAPAVYDVVNRQSKIVDRVQIPAGEELIGFGPNGAVYLIGHDGGRVSLLKAHVR